jgi:hypothetical protein
LLLVWAEEFGVLLRVARQPMNFAFARMLAEHTGSNRPCLQNRFANGINGVGGLRIHFRAMERPTLNYNFIGTLPLRH